MNNVLALIPARGGSKTLPRKNLLSLNGKPLIAWSIEAALQSKLASRVVVSTDDHEIADCARAYGAEVPFLRPAALSTDSAKTLDVIFHATDFFELQDDKFDMILLLQPTSPLRISHDIQESFRLMEQKNAQAIIAVSEVRYHPYWTNTLPHDHNMLHFLTTETINTNRQQHPDYYQINGAIYLSWLPYLRENNGFYGKDSFAYIMPKIRSVDIDDNIDFLFAELLMRESNQQSCSAETSGIAT